MSASSPASLGIFKEYFPENIIEDISERERSCWASWFPNTMHQGVFLSSRNFTSLVHSGAAGFTVTTSPVMTSRSGFSVRITSSMNEYTAVTSPWLNVRRCRSVNCAILKEPSERNLRVGSSAAMVALIAARSTINMLNLIFFIIYLGRNS